MLTSFLYLFESSFGPKDPRLLLSIKAGSINLCTFSGTWSVHLMEIVADDLWQSNRFTTIVGNCVFCLKLRKGDHTYLIKKSYLHQIISIFLDVIRFCHMTQQPIKYWSTCNVWINYSLVASKSRQASRWDGDVLLANAALAQELQNHLRKWLLSSLYYSYSELPSVVQNYLLLLLCYLSKARNALPLSNGLLLLAVIIPILFLPPLIISFWYQQLCGNQNPVCLHKSQQDLCHSGNCVSGTNKHPAWTLALNCSAEILLANLMRAWRETVNCCLAQLNSSWKFW